MEENNIPKVYDPKSFEKKWYGLSLKGLYGGAQGYGTAYPEYQPLYS